MAILLRESDVERLATTTLAFDAIEEAFRLQGQQNADNAPRRRCRLDKGFLHTMSASLPSLGYAGLKSYTSTHGSNCFMVFLYKEDGQLAAVIEADRLGQLRTGAASAVATKYMSREDSTRLGLFGTGVQARAQLQAICLVRPIKSAVAYSRNPVKCAKFCREMTELTGVSVSPANGPEEVVRDADIIVTATNSKEPVFRGEWLAEGTHINAIGANFLTHREIDEETVRRSACVIVDSCEQAMLECGDLEHAAKAEAFYWEDARELGQVVLGEFPGREDAKEITLFESQGIALEDVSLAARIYEKALREGVGERLAF